jgi:hypothetical protein
VSKAFYDRNAYSLFLCRMSVTTDQLALQVYTCNGIANNGAGKNVTIPRKKAHGGPKKYYGKHSCAVIEQVCPFAGFAVLVFDTVCCRRVGLVESTIQSSTRTRYMDQTETTHGHRYTRSLDKCNYINKNVGLPEMASH